MEHVFYTENDKMNFSTSMKKMEMSNHEKIEVAITHVGKQLEYNKVTRLIGIPFIAVS